MASNEAGLWEWLRGVLPLGQYSRIESPDTAPGFPDVVYNVEDSNPFDYGCVTGYLELKHSSHVEIGIPFKNERTGLHKSQRIWIRDAIRQYATVWIVAEVTPQVFVIPGKYYNKFNGADVKELFRMAERTLHIEDTENAAKALDKLIKG